MNIDTEIENQESWPPRLLKELTLYRETILCYQKERLRIDELCQNNIAMRINTPKNQYGDDYAQLAARCDTLLASYRFVAYHCTRLTSKEIANIQKNGLRVLSPTLVQRRLQECLDSGHLSQDEYQHLKNNGNIKSNLANKNGYRTGMIWLCPNRSTLKDSGSVYRLFRSWGGEAVYNGQENDAKISTTLAKIGSPCIVKCTIPFAATNPSREEIAKRLMSQFVADQFDFPDPSPGFDLFTRQGVPACRVTKVIDFDDAMFENLTECRNWGARHRL